MPRPKKPEVKRRQRRDPFARALEIAQKRLVKANAEYHKCLEKIGALQQEIPHLESIVAVHSGTNTVTQHIEAGEVFDTAAAPKDSVLARVPQHLLKFMPRDLKGVGSIPATKITATATLDADDELPTAPGEEILG